MRDRLVADEIASGALVKPFGDQTILIPDAYWIITPANEQSGDVVNDVIDWLQIKASKHNGHWVTNFCARLRQSY